MGEAMTAPSELAANVAYLSDVKNIGWEHYQAVAERQTPTPGAA